MRTTASPILGEEWAGKPSATGSLRAPNILDLNSLREELDQYYANMVQFRNQDPREILLTLSGYRARASQLRTHLLRNEERGPMQTFRMKELDPFRDECEFQFKLWSRLISAAQIDWQMSGGQT